MNRLLIDAIMIVGVTTVAVGQPQGQPSATETAVKMAGKAITLKYSAPSMSGRRIFGGAVPYGQVWRVGDGAPASFHTDADLEIQGLAVPKGDYTFYILPDATEWQLIISKLTGPRAGAYNQKMDLGRVPMEMKKAGSPVQTLRVTLTALGRVSGNLEFAWGDTIASVPFNIDDVKAHAEW
jgi:hypothetical protein